MKDPQPEPCCRVTRRVSGWRRIFTVSYWRFKWLMLRSGHPGAEPLETMVLEIPEGFVAPETDDDFSDYQIVTGR
jgi:hypothetical protein